MVLSEPVVRNFGARIFIFALFTLETQSTNRVAGSITYLQCCRTPVVQLECRG
jgi:hypothetical protein